MSTNIVAVYGTLREGLDNHGLIAECKRIGLGWLTGYRMHNLGDYPGSVYTHDDRFRIRGEWYKISDDVLASLDQLEGYDPKTPDNSLYIRKSVFSPYGRGWVYVYNQTLDKAPYMEAGDWKRHAQTIAKLQNTVKHQDAQLA